MISKRTAPYYNREFVEREFTPKQVAQQGKYLLYRALNIGRAVGFIGAGVSAAYGRQTWGQLIDEPGAAIRSKFLETNRRNEKVAITEALDRATIEGISDVDLLPLKAHLYRTLGEQRQPDDDPTGDPLEDEVRRRIANDDFVTQRAWRPFVEDEPQANDKIPWYDKASLDKWRAMDTWGILRWIVAELAKAKPYAEALKPLADHLTSNPLKNDARLSAEERWVLPLLLAIARITGKLPEIRRRLTSTVNAATDTSWDGGRSAYFDPARIILERLKFRRLLTTNYDFELERTLERIGFEADKLRPRRNKSVHPNSVDSSLTAQRPRGDRARAMVLGKNTAAELTGFAVQSSRFDYEVFHLHGRALDKREGRLVITERDYQDVYLRDSPEAHIMDEALTATMGGNPIVFFGMGMLEADILRPLRRFASSPGAQLNRSLIALMPTEEAYPRRVRTILHLYLRYGVHTVYYGDETSSPASVARLKRAFIAAPWQDRAQAATDETAPLYRSIARIAALRRALGFGSPEYEELRNWIGALAPNAARSRELTSEIAWNDFKPQDAKGDTVPKVRRALEQVLASRQTWQRDGGQRTAEAIRNFLAELDGRIRTRALCLSLHQLAEDRRHWWQQWRELPAPRRFAHDVRIAGPSNTWTERADLGTPLLRSVDCERRTIRSVRFAMPPESILLPPDEVVREIIEAPDDDSQARRRIFVVHTDPGAGRGTFFHHLASSFAVKQPNGAPKYAWGLFTNATFSTEYSSVIDGINDFLDLCTSSLEARANRLRGLPPLSRREGVLANLRRIYDATDSALSETMRGRRGIITIGGCELLFRRNGSPKNSEIVGALGSFLGDDVKDYPLDIVLVCGRDKIRPIFGVDLATLNSSRKQSASFGRNATAEPWEDLNFDAQFLHVGSPKQRDLTNCELQSAGLGTLEGMYEALSPASRREVASTPLDWRRATRARFQSAIVTRCAIETYRQAPLRTAKEGPGEATDTVRSFLLELGDSHSRADGTRTADIALSAVLRQYMTLGQDKLKVSPKLCETVLKHLAIMSAPVELLVLLICPEIKACLDEQTRAHAEHEMILTKTMRWLVEHRLCFRIASRRETADGKWTWGEFSRFAAHQSLQSYFFRQIGSPHLEFGDSRLFTVSLLASQPADLPAPSLHAYTFMRDLIHRLIKYPDQNVSEQSKRAELDRQRDVCALRAALGLVRSAFSLAVVSRFAEFGDPKQERRPFGYMEEFRLLLRWMIFQGGMLGIEDTIESDAMPSDDMRSAHKRERINALYPDEITWLYNECGLASLAQGNLYDAAALLETAARANMNVEVGSSRGPNAIRIRLNIAVAQFERGHLERANDELRKIREDSSGREPVVAAIARGYQGLVAHLRGRREQAGGYYKTALAELRSMRGEARAISVFSRHYGDLMRTDDITEARNLHRAALAEAENARQHDQIQRAQISIIRDELAEGMLKPDFARRTLHQLDEVIRYADRMELYSLKTEALTTRAHVIELQGETRGAGEAAVAALSMANLFGQRLRATMALNILGCVVADRPGYRDQARRLLRSARAMAENADYQLVLEMADRRLIELGTID